MLKHRVYTTLKALKRCDFARREDGTIAIEAMIILPLLFGTFLSLFSIFDAFRQYSLNQKAAYTVSDAISRETVPLDANYLQGVADLFEYMTRPGTDMKLRVTSVYYDAEDDTYKSDWSKTNGNVTARTDSSVAALADRLPVMVDNERIMVVETWSTYDPPFKTGLEQKEIKNFVFTRPRYAPRVLWSDGS